jgi:lipopolysaccharide/colanic/teichoic acid biosynthesis glycosyltransferase
MAKRAFDLLAGGVLLLLALPVIVVLAMALAVDLRAWPFFLQERIGKGGVPIRFLKLRTLPPDTPAYALKHDIEMSLSRFRAFLRSRHLDELPQLVHVLSGELSLVGPRPRMPDAHEPVDPFYARRRVTVPQGCTGLWQIGAGIDLLPSESPQYDLFYVDHTCLRLDLWILARTALQLLGLAAQVDLADVPAWAVRRAPAEVYRLPVQRVIDITSGALAAAEARDLVAAEDGAA